VKLLNSKTLALKQISSQLVVILVDFSTSIHANDKNQSFIQNNLFPSALAFISFASRLNRVASYFPLITQ